MQTSSILYQGIHEQDNVNGRYPKTFVVEVG